MKENIAESGNDPIIPRESQYYIKFDIIIRASFMYTVYFTTLSYALGNFCSLN